MHTGLAATQGTGSACLRVHEHTRCGEQPAGGALEGMLAVSCRTLAWYTC